MINVGCPICGSAEKSVVVYEENLCRGRMDFSARKNPDRYHYRMVRCVKCGLLYANPIMSDEEIAKLYGESGFSYDQEVENLKRTYGRCLKEAENFIAGKNNLLEVGCGNGFLLTQALETGWQNVAGVDPSREAIATAPDSVRDKIKLGNFRVEDWPADFFDVVFFAMVIEHIADVNGFLAGMKKCLKDGGVVLGIAHDENSFLSRLLKDHCPIINDEHVYVFNQKTLANIFSGHGFKIIKISPLPNSYSVNYWFKMLPLPKFFKKFLFKFLDFTGLGNKTMTLRAGNIFIIAQKVYGQ